MNVVQSTHQFADAAGARVVGLRGSDCELIIRQEPLHAKVAVGKEKDRKPVDPPPIIQLKINPRSDPNQNYLQSPYFFMSCNLLGRSDNDDLPSGPLGTALAGTLVSSLHRLKDADNADGAFFVFGDLSIKIEGEFRLQFNLYEMRDEECFHLQSISSPPFTVHPQKNFPGMSESTFITRSFSDQGVRLRLRKEPRTLLRKRGPASDDYQPRQYRTHNRQQSQLGDRQGLDLQDSSRQHPEAVESVQLPIHSLSYDQRAPQLSRGYSQSTAMGGFGDDPSIKRPRTGSEQSSTFSQHQSLESPQYPSRMYSDPQQNFSNPFASQQTQYGYSYTQSPQSSNNSSYDPISQRSPQSTYFPTQPQAIRFQQQPILAPSPPQRLQPSQSPFEGLGINTRTQMSPGMQATGMASMQPPTYGRMNTAPAVPGFSPLHTSPSFGEYPVNSGAMGVNLLGSRGPSMGTTSAPGF